MRCNCQKAASSAPLKSQCISFRIAGPTRRSAAERIASLIEFLRFVSDTKQAKRYLVAGIVQGVGFRFFTQHAAEKLRLSGYVRNLHDGRVEVYAIGTREQLAGLRAALEQGPRFSGVSEVREEAAPIDAQYEGGFVITNNA